MRGRPITPLIKISDENNIVKINDTNESVLKNFQNFMKEIIENKNESSFLSGDKNLVKFVLSKYLNIPEDELSNLKKLSIIITNDYGLLNQFGAFLPELVLLKLNNSNILSFNDIGTNFNNIECLQMKNCHLKSINGIICLQKLQILDIEDNEVSDLLDIDMCTKLNKLNISKNNISEIDNLSFLASMSNLEYLDIRNNPICNNNNANIDSTLSGISIVLWNHSHNILSYDIVAKFDEKIYNSPIKKKQNKMENEVNKILKDDDDKKNEIIHEKKSKIQIIASEKPKTKKECSKHKSDVIEEIIDKNINNNEEKEKDNTNNNKNSFRTAFVKKNQPLGSIKFNSGINFFVDKSVINNGTSIIGKNDSRKPFSAFKIIIKDKKEKKDDKSSFNKIKIKKIK